MMLRPERGRRRTGARPAVLTAVAAVVALGLVGALGASGGLAAATRASGGPTNTSPPTISGVAAIGQTLLAASGSWTGTITSFGYQWTRCGLDGSSCSNISGATSQSYTLQTADSGHTIVVLVTATSSDGQTTAASQPTAEVLGIPRNVSPPTVSGVAAVGHTLTASPGTWKSRITPSFYYQWARCDSAGEHCSNISGANSQKYVVAAHDVGYRIFIYVTANSPDGSSPPARSKLTPVVAASAGAPKNTRAPVLSGTAIVGQTLRTSTGTWSSSLPIDYFTYLWARCDNNGLHCANIAGAIKPTYVVTTQDVGHRLFAYVTANNSSGYATARSALTGTVNGSGPRNTGLPQVSGKAAVGQTLFATAGRWSSTSAITYFTYLWARCDSAVKHCSNIKGADHSSYTVTSADVGRRLIVYVTANTRTGYTVAHSKPTAVVPSPQPAGAEKVGNQISVPASSVALPDRLVIDKVSFSPNPLRSRRTTVIARFHVSDTAGHAVRGALVYMIGLPYGRITKVPETPTGVDGWATVTFHGTSRMPIIKGGALAMFVRARTPQGKLLAGASTRRLVQMRITR